MTRNRRSYVVHVSQTGYTTQPYATSTACSAIRYQYVVFIDSFISLHFTSCSVLWSLWCPSSQLCVCSFPRGALIANHFQFHILLMGVICCLYSLWSAVGRIRKQLTWRGPVYVYLQDIALDLSRSHLVRVWVERRKNELSGRRVDYSVVDHSRRPPVLSST